MPRRHAPVAVRLAAAVLLSLAASCGSPTAEEHLARARSRLESGDVNTALIEAKNAVVKAPGSREARALLGEVYLVLGDFAGAEKELAVAFEGGAPDPALEVNLTRALVAQGKHEPVIAAAVREAAGAGGAPSGLTVEQRAELQALRGHAYVQAEKPDTAKRLYQESLGLHPDNPEAVLGMARLTAIGGDLAGARGQLEALVAREPDAAAGWSLLGEVYRAQGEAALSERAHGEAIRSRGPRRRTCSGVPSPGLT